MKLIKNYKLFLESKTEGYKGNLVQELCTSMVLLNPTFLDNILDKGLKGRYNENSDVFVNDLKNLLMTKNRLRLGRYDESSSKFVEDTEDSKITGIFNQTQFSIEEDWNELVNSRVMARNICDKLYTEGKLEEQMIKRIYWIGPNKDKEVIEDLVVETHDGKQYGFVLNKNVNLQKTASFNSFMDDFIGKEDTERLFTDEYLPKWAKLTQEWVRIVYENANKNIQKHIEKFINSERIASLGYFEYFDIKHSDERFKNLGELIPEFDKNILYLSDLLKEIWNKKEECFMDVDRVVKEWEEKKIFIMNSRILEHLFTESLKKTSFDEIKKLEDGMKLAEGNPKMKIVKTIVEKLGCVERTIYYLGNNGNVFHIIPNRDFFRKNFDRFTTKFDYHVKLVRDLDDEEMNNFKIKLKLELDGKDFIDLLIIVQFSGGEMSGKLSAKYKFGLIDTFNSVVSEIG